MAMRGTVAFMALPCIPSAALTVMADGLGCSAASSTVNDHPAVGVGQWPLLERSSSCLSPKIEICGSKRLPRGSRQGVRMCRQQPVSLCCHVAGPAGMAGWQPSSSHYGHRHKKKKISVLVFDAVETPQSSCPRVIGPLWSFDWTDKIHHHQFLPANSVDKTHHPFCPAKNGGLLESARVSSTAAQQTGRAYSDKRNQSRLLLGVERPEMTRGGRWRSATCAEETTKDFRSDSEICRQQTTTANGALISLCASEIPRSGRSSREFSGDSVRPGFEWATLGRWDKDRPGLPDRPGLSAKWINQGRLYYAEEEKDKSGKGGIGRNASSVLPLGVLQTACGDSLPGSGSSDIDREEEKEEEEEEEWTAWGRTMDEEVPCSTFSFSSPTSFSSASFSRLRSARLLAMAAATDSDQGGEAQEGGGRVNHRGGGRKGAAAAVGLDGVRGLMDDAEEEEEEEEEEDNEKVADASLLLTNSPMPYVAQKLWRSYICSQFSSAVQSSPPPRQKQESALKDDYYVNVGYAIRTLREELPCLFYKEMTWDIYREDIVFCDPFNQFQGVENYKSIFWALRFHGRIFFRVLWVDVVRIWQPCDKVIMVRWTVRGVPRVPWESHGHFDGNSEYKLDENGKIYSHKVDNVIMTPKFRPRMVMELVQIAARASTPTPTYFFGRVLEAITNLVPYVQSFSWVRFYFALRGTLAIRGELPEAEA